MFFIDLAALTDPQLVPTAVASTLGFMVQTQDPLVSLLAFIGDRKILLVLDNCEHVIGVAAAAGRTRRQRGTTGARPGDEPRSAPGGR